MYLEHADFNGSCSILFFFTQKISGVKESFKMSRSFLKDSEVSDVAIYHWRPWWCSCTRYYSMSWLTKKPPNNPQQKTPKKPTK